MAIAVSVIIPTYNYGKYLKQAVESVLAQDFSNEKLEIIIVDGNSTDNTEGILSQYASNSHIRIFQQSGMGLSNAINCGLAQALGTYISRLDADDKFSKDIIKTEVEILEKNPHIDFVYPDYIYHLVNKAKYIRKRLPEFSVDELRSRGDFLSGGTMFRKSVFERFGGYDETVPTLDSYELILRLLQNGVQGYHIPSPMFEYTIHGSSLSDNYELIEATGQKIAQRYNIKYIKNENHPRVIPE